MSEQQRAPWMLKAISIKLNENDEPMALVGTPEGDRIVPCSEARNKVNLFEQLPEHKKRELARLLFTKYRAWLKEQQNDAEGPVSETGHS